MECHQLFKVNTVLGLVQLTESHLKNQQVPCKVLMVFLSNHSAGFLNTAGGKELLLLRDDAILKWIKRQGVALRGGLLCSDPGFSINLSCICHYDTMCTGDENF